MAVYVYNLTDSWENAGTTFVGIGLSITDTNSASGSKPVKITYNNTDYFTIDKSGNGMIFGTLSVPTLAATTDVTINGVSLSKASKLFGMMGNIFGGL